MDFRTVREDEMNQWFEFVPNTFANGNPSPEYKQYFKNHFFNDPWSGVENTFVAVDGDRIVSTLRVYVRRIYLFAHIIGCGAIGEVCTDSEYRGQGLSSKLLDMAIKYMEEHNMPVSTLRTGIFDFYGRKGWVPTEFRLDVAPLSLWKSGMPKVDKYKFRKINFEKDIPMLEATHNGFAAIVDGTLVRKDAEYWKKWIKTEASKNARVLCNSHGMPIAYADVAEYEIKDKDGKPTGENEYRLIEYAQIPSQEDAFDLCMCKYAREVGFNVTQVIFPKVLKSKLYSPDKKIGEQIDRCNMIRVNKPFKIGKIQIENTEELVKALELNDGFYFQGWDGY